MVTKAVPGSPRRKISATKPIHSGKGSWNGHRWHHWTWMPRIRIHSQKLQVMVVLQVNNLIWVLDLGALELQVILKAFVRFWHLLRYLFANASDVALVVVTIDTWDFTPPPSSISKLLSKGRHVAALLPKYITNSASPRIRERPGRKSMNTPGAGFSSLTCLSNQMENKLNIETLGNMEKWKTKTWINA